MQRRINPIVVFLTAALTLGSLLALVGHNHLDGRGHWSFGSGAECRHWGQAPDAQPKP
ncbi:hypothetical protein [Rudanella lutea]|uniref:hypothetical protein n=1 Tax=Rudanella lutea TaxID=451374 RepID=UPI0003A37F2F|nr:hypothetical protein [Rudanella lutea]